MTFVVRTLLTVSVRWTARQRRRAYVRLLAELAEFVVDELQIDAGALLFLDVELRRPVRGKRRLAVLDVRATWLKSDPEINS